jgi:uncharacterized protein (TIGR03067 family)
VTRTALTLCVLIASASHPGWSQKPLDSLQGSWVLTSLEGEGLPSGVHVGLVFAGDKYHGLRNGKIDERGTVKLDAGVSPMAIDLVIAEGKYAGKTQFGLVNVTGDAMTLVLGTPGSNPRPTKLTQSPMGLTRLKPIPKLLEGTWEGALSVNGQPARVVVHVSAGLDGVGTGTFTSSDQGTGARMAIAAIVQMGSRIRLIVPGLRGTYDAVLKDGQLVGMWSQVRVSAPLVLKRR